MKVSRLMHPNVVTCRTIDSLDRPAQLMWDHDIGCVPVLDEDGHLVGILTDRDICMAAHTHGAPLCAIPVASAMRRDVYACAPDDDIDSVEREMSRWQIRRMPVIDAQGAPIGMISLGDIARASLTPSPVSMREVATTLAAITTPRSSRERRRACEPATDEPRVGLARGLRGVGAP